jgi:outer membrane protein assembly factor BamB
VGSCHDGPLLWKFQSKGPIYAAPVIDSQGALYLCSYGGTYALDALTGQVEWAFAVPVFSTPLWSQGVLYFSSDQLYAVNTTNGKLRWKFFPGDSAYGTPATGYGTLYFGSLDHYLYAVDAGSGHLRWKFLTGGKVVSSPVLGP